MAAAPKSRCEESVTPCGANENPAHNESSPPLDTAAGDSHAEARQVRTATPSFPTSLLVAMSALPARRQPHLALGAVAILGLLGLSASADDQARPANQSADTVSLTIVYGDGVEKRFTRLPWRESMTVLELMNAAAKHPRGIRFEHRGRGATAFLTRIDDVENEGRGKNWIYRVNDKLADVGFGIKTLQAGDRVSWTFGSYTPNQDD